MIFQQIVLDLCAYNLHKNAEKPGVISFLSQIFCRKVVSGELTWCLSDIAYTGTVLNGIVC